MRGLGHQPSHKTFDLQFVLSTRCAVVNKMEQESREWPARDPRDGREATPDTINDINNILLYL